MTRGVAVIMSSLVHSFIYSFVHSKCILHVSETRQDCLPSSITGPGDAIRLSPVPQLAVRLDSERGESKHFVKTKLQMKCPSPNLLMLSGGKGVNLQQHFSPS